MKLTTTTLALTAGIGLTFAPAAQADLITEYMNNYGTVVLTPINPPANFLNGGTGWGGVWEADNSDSNRTRYQPNAQLTYNETGYSNFGNETGPEDGRFERANNSPENSRLFGSPITASTTWVSGLAVANRTDGRSETRITIDGDLGTTQFGFGDSNLAGASNQTVGELRIDGAANQQTTATFGSATHLVLARIDLNISTTVGATDRVRLYIDPDVSGVDDGTGPEGAAALGSPTLEAFGELGNTLNRGGFTFNQTGAILDQLRISDNGPDNGLLSVLSGQNIPEPASFALLGLGGLLLLPRRKRA